MRHLSSWVFCLCLSFCLSCETVYEPQTASYHNYRIIPELEDDSSLLNLIKPYRDSLDDRMNEVIGYADETFEKSLPNSTLGFFMTDAMRFMGEKKFGKEIDVAFVNYGGIRLNQLPKGEITIGKVFELMPFDNLVVIQDIPGYVLQEFLDHGAERGGWPMSGITMEIRNKKAVNVRIGGKPLDPSAFYTVANSDYVIKGGDNATMLKPYEQFSKNYLFRDAIIDYIKYLKAEGRKISPENQWRIRYAD